MQRTPSSRSITAAAAVRAKAAAHPEQAACGSKMQSPAPSSMMPSGSSTMSSIKPRALSAANAKAKTGSSFCRSPWRNRASTALPSSTTAAFAVKTRSGRPGCGFDGLDRGAKACRTRRRPAHCCSACACKAAAPAAPGGGIHPGIDAVTDREITRRAHQEARLQAFGACRLPWQAPRECSSLVVVVLLCSSDPNQCAGQNLSTRIGSTVHG